MSEAEQSGDGFKYWAFVSYSSKDKDIATRLHRKLESYSIPRDLRGRPGRDGDVPPKLFPVFRDRDELPLSSDLGGTIHGALKASRYLIVLCSPNSAKSRWVNEEILHFKRLGREDRIFAVILDGEPGATDMPGREEEECFPPALRFELGDDGELSDVLCEPIGGDLRKGGDGWERVFLKCLAGMTGLGFDAFARRQRKRKRRKQALMAVVGLLMLAAGIWTWDYNRLKVEWYAHGEEQWGVPVGIGALSEEVANKRYRHLRFENRRGKVRRVVCVNAAGTPAPSDISWMLQAALLEVIYSEEGEVAEHRLFQRDGREVIRRSYSEDGKVVEFKDPMGNNAAKAVSGDVGSLIQRGWGVLNEGGDQSKKTEITRWVLTHDERGFVSQQLFQNNWGAPRPNAEGIYGVRFQRNEDGLILAEQTLDEDGNPSAGKNGAVVEVRNEYGRFPRPQRFTFHDIDGELVRTPSGHAVETEVFDEWGNIIEKNFLGPEGELIRHPGGYAHVVARYGDGGQLLWQAYYDAEKKPILYQGEGYHGLELGYDEDGNEVSTSYFGVDEKPVLVTNGFQRTTMTHDEFGRILSMSYWGLEGEPVNFASYGVHRFGYLFDERGNLVESSAWDRSGKPTLLADGWHKSVSEFNANNWAVQFAFFGVNGEPVLDAAGIHRTRTTYDERGNVSKVRYFGLGGKKVMGSEGYHEYRATHDGRGNETGWAYFGPEGEAVVPKGDVYHESKLVFDEAGMKREQSYWGPGGEATVDSNGAHRRTYRYNTRGNQTEWRSFGVDGAPVIDLENGAHWETTVYDETGNALEVASWGVKDQAILNKSGYHRRTHTFDKRGNRLTEAYFGADGKPAQRAGWGVHKLVFEYDLFGQELTRRCYGVDDKPVVSAEGYHLMRKSYDGAGRLVSFGYHGVDEKPMHAPEGIHRIDRKYDEQGKELEWAYFDKEGKPAYYDSEGYHRLVYERDARGRELWARYYGKSGEPVIYRGDDDSVGGFHAREKIPNAEGHAEVIRYFDVDGEPMVIEDMGCHEVRSVFNGRGLILERRYFGVDGEAMERDGGLHRLVQTFDDRGNELSESYFGADGKPVLRGSVPCHREEQVFDRNGRLSERRYFGVDEEPVADDQERHLIRWKYDAFGKIAEIAYFGKKEEAVMDPKQGLHRMTRKNSPTGEIIEEIFWDTEGQRTAGPNGKSRAVWKYDGAGRLVLIAYFGVDDRPVEVNGVARREGSYDPVTGKLLEVRKYDAAGEQL